MCRDGSPDSTANNFVLMWREAGQARYEAAMRQGPVLFVATYFDFNFDYKLDSTRKNSFERHRSGGVVDDGNVNITGSLLSSLSSG